MTFERLWFNSMMPFFTTRAADSSLFAVAQGDNLNRQVYALMAAWVDVCQRTAAYYAITSVPWSKAYERYSASLADPKEEEANDFDWRKGFKAWCAIADEELISTMRSPDFLAVQRELLRAVLDLHNRQQEKADSVCRLFGVPTQHDFDELARQITELRREVRAGCKATQRDPVEDAEVAPDNQERDKS